MRIAVCDDSKSDLQKIVNLIGGRHEVEPFSCAEALLPVIEEDGRLFDLYIFDIFMNEMTGIELAQRIRKIDSKALFCFTSTSPDFYREALDMYALQYIIKPVEEDKFNEMLESASFRCAQKQEKSIVLTYKGKTTRVTINDILYIESQNHTLFFYLKGERVEKQVGQLADYENSLDSKQFARIHQSYIVNLYNMDSVDSSAFCCGKKCLPISRKYLDVKEKFRQMLFDEIGG